MGRFKALLLFITAFIIVLSSFNAGCKASNPSDDYARSHSIKLLSHRGSCSGEQVVAPSGKTYILTAAHCKILATDRNTIVAETEDKVRSEQRIVAEDPKSDLLLLEAVPGIEGLSIADHYDMFKSVRTFTHGKGYDTYKTEGYLIQIMNVKVGLGIMGRDYQEKCDLEKNLQIPVGSEEGQMLIMCALNVDEMATTAKIVHGSSGGMVVNEAGELVGVVSSSSEDFGFLVPLRQIKEFLKGY